MDPPPLCQYCEVIADWSLDVGREVGDEAEIPWHPSPASLTASQQHCPLCAMAVKYFSDSDLEDWFLSQSAPHVVDLKKTLGLTRLTWRLVLDPADASHTEGGFFWLVDVDTPLGQRAIWRDDAHGRAIFQDRIATIKEWMGECHRLGRYHERCKAHKPSKLPNRLLDLHTSDGTGNSSDIKLVVTEGLDASTKYAILSHCWGPPSVDPPLKTTLPLVDEFLATIPFKSLPKNYRDAVMMARILDIRYLWIDSLCIIQDDPRDWEMESANMASYYQGSYLTIAAGASADCHGGFCRDLDQSPLFRVFAPGNSSRRIAVRETAARENSLRYPEDKKIPLLRRGWVLQEQVLSPRTVFCTDTHLFWQCHSLFTSEDGAVHMPGLHSLGDVFSPEFDLSNKNNAQELWQQWIKDYSHRELTYPTDRAPAIAGLVEFYQSETGHTPLLGLWKESLCYDLSWQCAQSREWRAGLHKPQAALPEKPNKFPAWSWLSALGSDGHTDIFMAGKQTPSTTARLEVVSAAVLWYGPAFTSELQSAKLRLRGLVKEINLDQFSEDGIESSGSFFLDKTIDGAVDGNPYPVTLLHLYQEITDLPDGIEEPERDYCGVYDTVLVLSVPCMDDGGYRRLGQGLVRHTVPLQVGKDAVGTRHLDCFFQDQDQRVIEPI